MRNALKRPTEDETNLSGFQLFNKLKEEEFNRLNYEKTCSLYKKGTIIYREGSRLTGFFCVTNGIVDDIESLVVTLDDDVSLFSVIKSNEVSRLFLNFNLLKD